MRRPVRFVIAAALGAAALLGIGAAPATATAQSVQSVQSAALAGQLRQRTDDFSFDSFHADFLLGRSGEGHSTLSTTETIVARFPADDQNHGIRRAIPTHYRGVPTDIRVQGITDENGAPRDYESDASGDDGDFLVLTIAADEFVHGAQTYSIRYTQTNVTLFPDDGAAPEFNWEVNGTGWAQPFGAVTATVRVQPALLPRLTGDTACYQGGADSELACDSLRGDEAGSAVAVAANDLGPHEGLTLVVGFTEGTFVPRDASFWANPFPALGAGATLVGLLTMIAAAVARGTRWRNRPGRPTIVAEYLPPRGVNLLQAGDVSLHPTRVMAATFLSLAVRGNVRVLEGAGTKHYLLELLSHDGLDEAELAIVGALFPGGPGTIRDLKKKDAKLSTALQGVSRVARKRMLVDGLRAHPGGALRAWLLALALLSGAVSLAASIGAGLTEVGGAWPVVTVLASLMITVAAIALSLSVRPLTAAGAELRDYLKGVKLYIGLAEADRLRVLQSPAGALRSPYRPDAASVPGTGDLQVLKLYERLLPLAVLFGQAKQWSGVLGEYYTRSGSQPDWYAGSGSFNAAYFALGISAFSASATTSWSGSSASSSSSGLGGGGSVSGGGGGGGGGGV